MKKFTQKDFKALAACGAAVDITKTGDREKIESYEVIGLSRGVYGINGALLLGKSGTLYVITARNSNLLQFV